MGIVREWGSSITRAYRQGDRIHGSTVTGIRDTRVYLQNGENLEYLDLLEAPPAALPILKASLPRAPKNESPFVRDLQRGIKPLSEHRYELRRDTLNAALENLPLIVGSARVQPEWRDGRTAGFRVTAVRAQGPFDLIGLRDGDVVYSLNGLEITSPEKALEAYAKLKSAGHLSLGLERNGRRLTKEYSIN